MVINLPARIAFPGWVNFAFPAGAAAARHRGLGKGLINVPLSCIITGKHLAKAPKSFFNNTVYVQAGLAVCFQVDRRAQHMDWLRSGASLLDAGDPETPAGLCVLTVGGTRTVKEVLDPVSVICHHGNDVSRQLCVIRERKQTRK